MGFIDSIFSLVWDIASWFYQLYYESQDIPIVGGALSSIFLAIYRVVWSLLTPIAHFSDWVNDVSLKVSSILSQADIFSLLRTWLTYAENAWGWIVNAWQNVTGIINTWWSSASQVVMVWVNDAKQYAASLVSGLSSIVLNLQTAWESFRGKIPSLDEVILWWGNWSGNVLVFINDWWAGRLLDIQGLISSSLKPWEDLFNFWGEFGKSIKLFFTDPEDWLYKAADRIIERFW